MASDAAELAAAFEALGSPEALCEDNLPNCVEWAQAGECGKNPSYMNNNCRLSCKQCAAKPKKTKRVKRDKQVRLASPASSLSLHAACSEHTPCPERCHGARAADKRALCHCMLRADAALATGCSIRTFYYFGLQAQSGKVNPDQAKQVAPDLVSPPGKDEATPGANKKAEGDAVSEPVLKPELKTASKPKTKGADGRREAAEARREAAQKVSPPRQLVRDAIAPMQMLNLLVCWPCLSGIMRQRR